MHVPSSDRVVSRPMTLVPLRAGPLAMAFDPATAFLRYVRLGGREVLRGVFGAVRDRNWDTVGPDIRDVRVDAGADGFSVTFDAICRRGDVDFVWHGEVTGTAAGVVTFVFDGEARASFLKNRIGLCVLHPIRECAGGPCRITHVDGTMSEGTFPRLISPDQPFRNMRAISYDVVSGVRATVAFEGDVFEMEDQRNWTDASFKTYGTPLDLPVPVRLDAGARVRQTVTLRLRGTLPHPLPHTAPADTPEVRIDWSARRHRPPIGFGMATTGASLKSAAHATLARLAADHVRIDVPLSSAGWRERLHEAAEVAARARARLHAALFLSDAAEQELEAVRTEVETYGLPVGLWLVFHAAEKCTSACWVALAQRVLGTGIPLAAGTNAYFAELNRNRPPADTGALPCFSINPQVHAFDDRSLVETLEAQRSTVETARSFCAMRVVISPVTLRPRFNPNATDAGADGPPDSDPRQATLFGAAWTLGTLARLATCPDVRSLTFFETAGPRGVMDEDGRLYPLGHIFAAVAGWDDVAGATSDAPLRVDALALKHVDGRQRVLLAGFGAEPVRIVLEDVDGTVASRVLGKDGFGAPDLVHAVNGRLQLQLPPAGVLLLDFDGPALRTPARSPAEAATPPHTSPHHAEDPPAEGVRPS